MAVIGTTSVRNHDRVQADQRRQRPVGDEEPVWKRRVRPQDQPPHQRGARAGHVGVAGVVRPGQECPGEKRPLHRVRVRVADLHVSYVRLARLRPDCVQRLRESPAPASRPAVELAAMSDVA